MAVTSSHKQNALRKTLQKLVSESWTLLNGALRLEDRGLAHILSPEYFSRTVGMFEQNNVGVRLVNPISLFVSDLLGLQYSPSIPTLPSVLLPRPVSSPLTSSPPPPPEPHTNTDESNLTVSAVYEYSMRIAEVIEGY